MEGDLSTSHSAPYTEEPVRFTGSGGEYFRIWIVNLLLTIVTFGIYSAWAKVRRLHYFYRHTELAGSSFDFHGDPVRILIGRIIAVAMIATYNFAVRLQSAWTLAVIVLFAVITPWLLRNSLRFRLYNTSWRGTRFHFRGSVGGAYRVFLLNGILTIVTLYLLAPFAHQRLKAWQHGNSRFGRTPFTFSAGIGKFYLTYLLVLLGIIVFGVIAAALGLGGVLAAINKPGGPLNPKAVFMTFAILWLAATLIGLSIGSIFRAALTNLIWNNTSLGEHRIACRMSWPRLMWITFSNLVLVVVTLGFFMPWASVRLFRFQAESFSLLRTSDLTEFVDAEPEGVGAIGEEAASVFDFDISL